MGHSYGGATVISEASHQPDVKAVIALDPWLFPIYKDKITFRDTQQSLIIMSEGFPKEIYDQAEKPPSDYKHLDF
jgi:dienelactone hydrolase